MLKADLIRVYTNHIADFILRFVGKILLLRYGVWNIFRMRVLLANYRKIKEDTDIDIVICQAKPNRRLII